MRHSPRGAAFRVRSQRTGSVASLERSMGLPQARALQELTPSRRTDGVVSLSFQVLGRRLRWSSTSFPPQRRQALELTRGGIHGERTSRWTSSRNSHASHAFCDRFGSTSASRVTLTLVRVIYLDPRSGVARAHRRWQKPRTRRMEHYPAVSSRISLRLQGCCSRRSGTSCSLSKRRT